MLTQFSDAYVSLGQNELKNMSMSYDSFLQVTYDMAASGRLTHCGLVMPYGDTELGQHRFR